MSHMIILHFYVYILHMLIYHNIYNKDERSKYII